MDEEKRKELRRTAMALPGTPGVYLMHDKTGKIIYIGKAKNLKNRVSQYFGSERNHGDKVRKMVSCVERFEHILTDTEFEALVLECALIKQYSPKYNILLKDDKGYSYLKISSGDWPRLSAVYRKEDDTSEYLGPYMSSWAVKEALDEARRIFRLPDCTRRFPEDFGKSRPCLNFYIDQCAAPCRGKISNAEYRETFSEAVDFLKGGSAASLKKLTEKMLAASENLEFEKAARLRDRIGAIRKMNETQKVVSVRVPEQDVIALSQGKESACACVFRFTGGMLRDRENFLFENGDDLAAMRTEFIERYYSAREKIPPQITLDGSVKDSALLQSYLTDKAGRTVRLVFPKKGEQDKIVELCRQNAAEALSEGSGRTGRETYALDELARLLCLKIPPERIEAYDISNLAGEENVGGMVVFKNGRPEKASYRKFKIRTVIGQDDFASLAEVLDRRLSEYEKQEDQSFSQLPDLILLDGGKGQLSAVCPILIKHGVEIPMFGMVKDDKHRTRAIAGDGGEISITASRRAFTLISDLQEEVHRFTIGYHRERRKITALHLKLTEIPGVGDARAKTLMSHFKTTEAISKASVQDLNSVPGISEALAEKIYSYFHVDTDTL